MKAIKKTTACLLICTLPFAALPVQAGMVPSGAVAGTGAPASTQGGADRERVNALLQRADVQAELQKYGVSGEQARSRVATMTDEEVKRLAGSVDRAPAGGDGVIGVLFTVFVILLVTDIFGFTKVFPFTRSIR